VAERPSPSSDNTSNNRKARNDRALPRASPPPKPFGLWTEHCAGALVEEEQGRLGLVLGRGRDLLGQGQMGEEASDLCGAHVTGVPFLVEEDVSADPPDIDLLSGGTVMPEADGSSDLIEKPGRLGGMMGGVHPEIFTFGEKGIGPSPWCKLRTYLQSHRVMRHPPLPTAVA